MRIKSFILLGIALSIISMRCLAFHRVFVYEKPLRANCLCGQIQLPESSEPAEGVLVEQCAPNWEHVISSTYTDKNGEFHFPKTQLENMHYLRISRTLFRTICIKVMVSPKEKKKILINLQFD